MSVVEVRAAGITTWVEQAKLSFAMRMRQAQVAPTWSLQAFGDFFGHQHLPWVNELQLDPFVCVEER